VLGVEHPCDRDGAVAAGGVEVEDPAHDRRLPLAGDQLLVLVAAVAVRDAAVGPVALLRAPLDPGGDAVHDRRVLELGEHTEHLQHHPPGGRAGVERLRRRAQHDVEPVQLLGELRELTHLSGEAVDAVDEQQIRAATPREIERSLQAGPVELRARRTILMVGDDPPVLLRRAERFESVLL